MSTASLVKRVLWLQQLSRGEPAWQQGSMQGGGSAQGQGWARGAGPELGARDQGRAGTRRGSSSPTNDVGTGWSQTDAPGSSTWAGHQGHAGTRRGSSAPASSVVGVQGGSQGLSRGEAVALACAYPVLLVVTMAELDARLQELCYALQVRVTHFVSASILYQSSPKMHAC